MKDIILIGGGGHCKAVIDVVEQAGEYKIMGIVDKPELFKSSVLGYQVIGSDNDLGDLAKLCKFALITVGQINSPKVRKNLFEIALSVGFIMPNIISPSAYVSVHAKLNRGSVIMHGAIINASSSLGDNCIINSKALIEHDSVIGNFCHVSTGACINGGAVVGEGSFIGSGAITRHNAEVPPYSFIKAGSVVK
jgi:sugar O-acyltransferase (sialic acid O-acetyltransferase NeuD family)